MKRTISIAFLLALVACVGPARSFGGYERKATHTADQAEAAVETTRLGILNALRNDAFAPYLSVTIRDAEETISSAQGYFESIQPPDQRSDQLRDQLTQLLSDASDTVEDARIAIRRGDTATLAQLQGKLGQLSQKLDAFLDEHE